MPGILAEPILVLARLRQGVHFSCAYCLKPGRGEEERGGSAGRASCLALDCAAGLTCSELHLKQAVGLCKQWEQWLLPTRCLTL